MNRFLFNKCIIVGAILLLAGASFTTPLQAVNQVINFRSWEFFTTIQDAINAPNTLNGDYLFVAPGTYQENVWIYKSIALIGDPQTPPVISGVCTAPVVKITVDEVTVRWFIIEIDGGPCGPIGAGVYITSDDNILFKNTIRDCYRGVYLYGASGNVLSGNTIYDHYNEGILLNNSPGNWIYSNTVTGNDDPDNGDYGLVFLGSSENAVYANIIEYNNYGIYLAANSNDNKIHHNNFLGNAPYHAWVDPVLPCTGSEWDNGSYSGGNYWSGLTGADANNDLIIDTAYTIPGDPIDQDQYPLVGQWSPVCGNVNGDPRGLINLSDITSLISYIFSNPGTPEPIPPCVGDANGNGSVYDDDVIYGDVDYLIDYVFNNGPAPVCNCGSDTILVLPWLYNQ